MVEGACALSAPIVGVILAGGRSTRMGRDKATLPFRGARLVDHQLSVMRDAVGKRGVVVVSGEVLGCDSIPDIQAGLGPIGGIRSILAQARRGQRILFLPVDMPEMSASSLRQLLEAETDEAAVFDGYEMPLLLVVSPVIQALVESACAPHVHAKQRSVRSLLGTLRVERLTANEESAPDFRNLNRRCEWSEYENSNL